MRKFLQRRAGATYFANSRVTVNIRKYYVEYIFSIPDGWHIVVNVMPSDKEILFFVNLGSFVSEVEKVLPGVKMKPEELQKFRDTLEGKDGFEMVSIDPDSDGETSGFARRKKNEGALNIFSIIGNPEVMSEAILLQNRVTQIFNELSDCSIPQLKSLTHLFFQ